MRKRQRGCDADQSHRRGHGVERGETPHLVRVGNAQLSSAEPDGLEGEVRQDADDGAVADGKAEFHFAVEDSARGGSGQPQKGYKFRTTRLRTL
jgi:hypothetical protein